MTVKSSSRKFVRIVVNERLLKASLESTWEVLLTLKFNLAGAKRIISISFNEVLIGIQNRFVNLLVLNNASTWCGKKRKAESQEKWSELWTRLGAGGNPVCLFSRVFHEGIKQRLMDFSLWFFTIAKEWFLLIRKGWILSEAVNWALLLKLLGLRPRVCLG